MDAASISGGVAPPVARTSLARMSVRVGASALATWVFGAGVFLVALTLRDVPDQVMVAVVVCVGVSLLLALAGTALAIAALLRHGGRIALTGLGLSLLGVLLAYLAPALGIVAAGLMG